MKKPGDKYRPSNSDEGMNFEAHYCHKCRKDDPEMGCIIILMAMAVEVEAETYPEEWTYTAEGKPTCTAFHALPTEEELEGQRKLDRQERIQRENKQKKAQGQLTLFEVMA